MLLVAPSLGAVTLLRKLAIVSFGAPLLQTKARERGTCRQTLISPFPLPPFDDQLGRDGVKPRHCSKAGEPVNGERRAPHVGSLALGGLRRVVTVRAPPLPSLASIGGGARSGLTTAIVAFLRTFPPCPCSDTISIVQVYFFFVSTVEIH